MHSVAEQLRQACVQCIHGRLGATVRLELRRPALHVGRLHGRQRNRPEAILDDLYVDFGLTNRRLAAGAVPVEPGITPLRDRGSRRLRRDVITTDEGGGHRVDPLLRVDLPAESARVFTAGVVDVPRSPSQTTTIACGWALHEVSVSVLDTLAPQVLDAGAQTPSCCHQFPRLSRLPCSPAALRFLIPRAADNRYRVPSVCRSCPRSPASSMLGS